MYALEGIVLALQFFFDKVSHLKHPSGGLWVMGQTHFMVGPGRGPTMIFSLPVPTRPGTRLFWQVSDPTRPEVKNPYPSDPDLQVAGSSKNVLLLSR